MTNKFCPPENYIELLNNYCYKCERTFKNLEVLSKRELREIIPILFKKWFFSSTMDNTIVSPANILTWEADKDDNSLSFADTDLIISAKKSGLNKYVLRHRVITFEDHPLIEDMKTVLNFCSPVAELDEKGNLNDRLKSLLKTKLNTTERFYIDYISALCIKLKLLVKMPSLFTEVYCPSDDHDEFFERSGRDILEDILFASIEICSGKIANDLVLPASSFSSAIIYAYFKKCVPVNEIIKDVYSSMGFDIEKLLERCDDDNLSFEDQSLLASINYVGHLIDKWYITPLSAYLRLIRPLYPLTNDLTEKLNLIADIYTINGYADTEIFYPPNLYSLTPLGKSFSDTERYEFDQTIPKDIPKGSIYDVITNAFMTDKFHFELEDFIACSRTIFSLRVKDMKDPHKWIVFEADNMMTLSALSFEIMDAFELGEGHDYTFIKKTKTNVDLRYSYKSKKSGFNEPESISLNSVMAENNDKLYLDIPKISAEFVIILLKTDIGKGGILYPRPIRQSRLMDDLREKFD
ncbi:MAG: hypothetical protein E7235_03755 [Lachnospiraceae bacterium]|nr:hypothetical protein [Lachnospiraceae bacterium]